MKKLKFSQWCDAIKDRHAYCVYETMTEKEFAWSILESIIIQERGCSLLVARGRIVGEASDRYDKTACPPMTEAIRQRLMAKVEQVFGK